ncbi:MAG: PEP-CTERM-box response regulator transcription factor [Gammaproteobacteria bacterium]|nr:PEP-CTERM-box response regulator transcription factor [Gammaproteobacteria bacterium]NIR84446.1 PEP-CTERM-box response regulator transcription factor [Gammaproteobacteria bacterium]NIR90927.1 PEP-CTERM-box response regulator transcription factor [Gammaproteobacteria bacterium]NIU07113.1 PEP-CTERM-box response regulator transcription factor [Gammaproteobacteria bacterium]NIV76242.1 PEP-CTERM-box response regulator transcription factor [Gammaproteobacteria bacterium]
MSARKKDKPVLLIVEDDPGLQSQLRWCFESYDVVVAGDKASALAQLRRRQPPVVTLDLGLPPDPANVSEGFATLSEILRHWPGTKVIVVTGNDDRENAVRAIGMGAYDFYEKPVDPDMLGLIVGRAYQLYGLEVENRRLARRNERSPLDGVIAASPQMTRVCETIEKVAPAEVSVLLLGESGTGKELLARSIHNLSARADKRCVVINCAAIPETLLESELFGYEKGAFTGAAKQTIGKIEHADGGTLFLDEIGDLSPSLQAKLLRFLQERIVERLGGRDEIPVDVRVVCATHQDLKDKIEAGEFREDLYYRIAEVTITIPPLRERDGDALLLAWAFLERYARAQGRSLRGFSEEALGALEAYPWPGNARELENRVKRAVIMAEGQVVTPQDLDLPRAESQSLPLTLREAREQAERKAIQRALVLADNRVAQAAEMLGVSRPTLYDLMDKYGLKP